MVSIILQIIQFLSILLIAPLLTGAIKKSKALLQGRVGPRLLQPYFDLYKYMHKDSFVSKNASWIFLVTPYIVFGATLTASALIPAFVHQTLYSFTGDIVLIIYLFALSRFFISMSAVDTGSSFGAQGASRDLFISSLAEPVLFITILGTALPAKTTNLSAIIAHLLEIGLPISPAYFMILVAFVILLVTETGRVPVDNPDTHLELTMIHEGPLLEYSGKPLALLMWSAWIKQAALFTLFIDLCIPWGPNVSTGGWALLTGPLLFFLKMFGVGLIMACIEIANAKMRLFKVPRLLAAAFLLSFFSLITEYLL
ncbi:NADH-quinone oxidoreductase subunit H [Neobacillus sp. PS3-40]|uniref:respiratory chain complex I subunit 1 family protein n=1 Tax=Neobacillus sp. PS3-40 TaxID=3070679 RepID=UPI0027E17DBD|nr:NADH-quinone oxidoreductase subunit H [Neobacillus sp. PS3-40]WML44865.1 NADH-quinone oxidoreductase subunit H [Neobacillus sp. PS3-40]